MNRFGLPLVPSGLALWALNFSDRFFLARLSGQDDVGRYSIGVRIASAMVLLLVAFRTAWPAFAYSIDDEREAKRTYAFVLTYLLFVACWLSLALGVLAPWIVQVLARNEAFWPGADVVAPLAFAGALLGRVHRRRDRDRPAAQDAVQLGDHRLGGRDRRRAQPRC